MDVRPGKKWQNLIHRTCPYDGSKLEPIQDRTLLYECRVPGCEFLISQRSFINILSDE